VRLLSALKTKLIDDPYAWSKKKPVFFWRGSTTQSTQRPASCAMERKTSTSKSSTAWFKV